MLFNQIPAAIRVPFTYIEFDSSNASSGSAVQPYRIFALGNKLSAGTQAANTVIKVTSDKQAETLFGRGSQLTSMLKSIRKNNDFTEIFAMGIVDNASGVAAAGSVSFTGPSSADGIVNLYIAGKNYEVAVLSGDTATEIATTAAAKITADLDAQVLGVVDGTDAFKVNVTSKHKGAFGNDINIQVNYNDESLPAGVGTTIVAFASGAGNPDITAAIAAIGDDQYRSIAFPYQDATNLGLFETELTRRWGPLTQNDGSAFMGYNGTSSAAQTFGLTRNSPFFSSILVSGSPTTSWEIAGALAAAAAYESAIDPARPMNTVALLGVLAPKSKLTLSERNACLFAGIATSLVDAGGVVRIEKLITMYRQNSSGVDDVAFLDYTTVANLSYLRYDLRTYFGVKYARFKLADDGNQFQAGQKVMTPKLAKGECVARYQVYMQMGLVENLAAFKDSLIVERNLTNRNRLDIYLAPDLINALDIIAARVAFIV